MATRKSDRDVVCAHFHSLCHRRSVSTCRVLHECALVKRMGKVMSGLLGSASAFCLWWTGMNYTGYCHAQGRYLGEDELINVAVREVLNHYPPTIVVHSEKIGNTGNTRQIYALPENPVFYADVNEFMQLNPNCCALSMRTGEGRRPWFLDRIFGKISSYVLLEYSVRYVENGIEKNYPDSTAVAVENCGEILTEF